ncbi:acetyl-CoA/propionyl-CoA carboxylase biotin carboxyl carrier protein [Microbacterium keratanolyticum]|uniref:biotin carboxylase n=1 Tax=Microbacterium keratanolyticum TaxID=67574 RepID=A0A9W6M992_9MICO|nr:biotin carboxylase N-terminal domain-containing protein [Microbacterium keratanolyticum]MBM7470269.1 acetyl-CoA/propionyl-CoA carboxylase biotin carboxyl carrier protein [Microbacterium keratanolyticum]GLK02348.1 acetyl/propionyl-CoA carboxylase subunit alpha [Microbacterium keratanolyticum]
MTHTPLFDTVLVANRGEIARRIIRTLRALGIRSVAVYSDGDATAPHVREADVAVRLGPDPATSSYLRIDAVIAAAQRHGAQAIHPGYGFLSENAAFADACAAAGIVFIGPSATALEIMGDKATARAHVMARGVPVAPGFSAVGLRDDEIAARAAEVGYPLLVKPSAGGGGKGMEIAQDAATLQAALDSARRIAAAAFGDDSLVLERLVARPRHIEVQVFGDQHGTVIALGERECTLQRRHQKVIEEAPSAGLPAATRDALLAQAVRAAESVDYVGAGTVEFLVDADDPATFFFIEMNTRLQVEHPVTEEVTGLDLVELQLLVAAGRPLPERATAPVMQGHAVEARVYAEAPARGFLPSLGTIVQLTAPAGVRVDSAVETGSTVSGAYDPMIAKIIAYAPDRRTALERLDAALAQTVVLGVDTNIAFLRQLCQNERVREGDIDTGLIETLLPIAPSAATAAMLAAAAGVTSGPPSSTHVSALWAERPGWRLGRAEPRAARWFRTDDDEVFEVPENADTSGATAAVDADGAVWVSAGGDSIRLRPIDRAGRFRLRRAAMTRQDAAHDPLCRAPMPGTVVALHVSDGAVVRTGDRLVSIEAMKMEHPVLAPRDGTVSLLVAVGDQVRREQSVARIVAPEEPSASDPEAPDSYKEHLS